MRKYLAYLVLIILGTYVFVGCLRLGFDEAIITLDYRDVNKYAENQYYWGNIDGKEVKITDKQQAITKVVSLDFVPSQIAFGDNYMYILKRGDNIFTTEAGIYCYDYQGNFVDERVVENCNYLAVSCGKIFLQYWINEDQSVPFSVYGGIAAHAWLEEEDFNGNIALMEADAEGKCYVGEQLFYQHSEGYFSTEQEFESQSQVDKLLIDLVVYDRSEMQCQSYNYQSGNYVYGVINIWKEDARLQDHYIPLDRVVKSYAYCFDLRAERVDFLVQLEEGRMGIVTTEGSVTYYEANRINKLDFDTGEVEVLCEKNGNDIGNIILQHKYLLIPGQESEFIYFGA